MIILTSKKIWVKLSFWILSTLSVFAQTDSLVQEEYVTDRIFSSYLEFGYVSESSDQLGGGLLIKSAFEFRLRGNSHIFFRANYDSYNANTQIEIDENASLVLGQNASMADFIVGPGFRFGAQNLKVALLLQSGIKQYSYPTRFEKNDVIIQFMEEGNSVITSRFSAAMEYYFDKTFAVSFELFGNRVLESEGYWKDKQGAVGFSIGLVGTFF